MPVCEIDLRPGGAWRYVLRDPDNGNEYGFSGVYREIVPPERLVYTEGFEAMPGHDYLVTTTFAEQDGKTTLTSTLLYKSVEDRDGHLQSGMEGGMRETLDRLAEPRHDGITRPRSLARERMADKGAAAVAALLLACRHLRDHVFR